MLEGALRALERAGLVAKVQALVGRASAFRTELVATLTAAGLSHAHADSQASSVLRGAKQHAALEALADAAGGLGATTLR